MRLLRGHWRTDSRGLERATAPGSVRRGGSDTWKLLWRIIAQMKLSPQEQAALKMIIDQRGVIAEWERKRGSYPSAETELVEKLLSFIATLQQPTTPSPAPSEAPRLTPYRLGDDGNFWPISDGSAAGDGD